MEKNARCRIKVVAIWCPQFIFSVCLTFCRHAMLGILKEKMSEDLDSTLGGGRVGVKLQPPSELLDPGRPISSLSWAAVSSCPFLLCLPSAKLICLSGLIK